MWLTSAWLLLGASLVLGDYDTLLRRADQMVPSRTIQLRDQMTSLLEPGMYQELMFNVMSYVAPTDSDNPLCNNHSTQLQMGFLQDELWAAKTNSPQDQMTSLLEPGMYQELMFIAMSYVAPTDSDNPLCNNHSTQLQMGFLQDELWATKMIDATSKLPNGVYRGNFQDLGSFEECISVDGPAHSFTGQMCVVQTRGLLPNVVPNPETTQYTLTQALDTDFVISVCVPDSCSPRDVSVHWQSVMEEFNASASVSDLDCSTRESAPLSQSAKIALFVLAVLTILVLSSTYYDYSVKHQPTKEKRILMCFSVRANLRRLLSSERGVDNMDVIDGLRFFAICWIVLGHRFSHSLLTPRVSLVNNERYITAWFMAPLLNMPLAVEMFFLLSGCLLAFSFLKERTKNIKFNLFHFYYKRYLRLTPAMAMVMMVEGCLLLYMGDGPIWKRITANRRTSCADYWWTNILYVSNYVNPYRTCVLQTWYLSADMQLYLLSPLLLLPLGKSPRKGLLLIALCYLATTTASFFNAYFLHLPAGSTVSLDRKTEQNHGSEYVVTHVRAASWLTGLILGYIIHTYKNAPFKMSKVTAGVCWVVSVSLCVSAVFSIVPFQSLEYKYNPLVDSLHIALHRNIFSLGLAGILLLCVFGKGGFMKDILSWKGLRPFATLTYGIYLCHMGLQNISFARIRQPLDFDMFRLWTTFLSDLGVSSVAAALLFISVEAPFTQISTWLYNPRRNGDVKSNFAATETENKLSAPVILDTLSLEIQSVKL